MGPVTASRQLGLVEFYSELLCATA